MKKLPSELKKKAIFYTDYFSVYHEIIPDKQHRPVGKGSEKTNYIERFNCTLRQRCFTLSSKDTIILKEIRKSHRSYKILHMRLQ